mmetsp:Transcript_44353/g.88645  ORF Transcript_44353/g.88645 Transcript_44353/m.88645 type:complete len:140 (+) Transcript_44353:119-538(+)
MWENCGKVAVPDRANTGVVRVSKLRGTQPPSSSQNHIPALYVVMPGFLSLQEVQQLQAWFVNPKSNELTWCTSYVDEGRSRKHKLRQEDNGPCARPALFEHKFVHIYRRLLSLGTASGRAAGLDPGEISHCNFAQVVEL